MHQIDVKELRLQTDPTGEIWAITWLKPTPHRIASNVQELVESDVFQESTSVAIIAFQINVVLITEIYLQRHGDPDYSIWVASPVLVTKIKHERVDPSAVLEASCKIDPHLSPSLGGWHQFGREDYPAYALAEMVARDTSVSDLAIKLLKAHPVWPALSFISGLNLKMCCRLVSTILDPRWYVDCKQPARTARLESYLGLSPRTQRAVLHTLNGINMADENSTNKLDTALSGMTEYDARMVERCTTVQYCWWRDPDTLTEPASSSNTGTSMLEAPGGFLWRVWLSHGHSSRGYLRTSQQFIRFLRDSWLDALYAKTVGDGLFVPSYFFKHNYEHLAFVQHMERAKGEQG